MEVNQESKEGVKEKSRNEVFLSYKFNKEISELRKLYNAVKAKYEINALDMFNLLHQEEIFISTAIFNDKLSALETIVKYLHENTGLEFNEIAELLNRNSKTIWQAYDFARRKMPEKLEVKKTKYFFSVSILAKRELSVLENIVGFLRTEYSLKFSKIAELLSRDVKTIWTINKRAEKKLSIIKENKNKENDEIKI